MEEEFKKADIAVEFVKAFDAKSSGMSGRDGCTQSHYSIFMDIISKGYKNALIFEDDVQLTRDFKMKIENLKEPSKWDLLYIHSMNFISEHHREGDFVLGKCLSTAGYVISKEACEKLTVFDPLDIHIDLDIKLTELPLNTWVCYDKSIIKAEMPWTGDIGIGPDRINKEIVLYTIKYLEARYGGLIAFVSILFLVKFLLRKWIRI